MVRQSPLHLSGARVLELGCGTGKNSQWLATQARELVALDFSPGMLDVARRRVRAAHVRFVERDITHAWPVEPASVDVVVPRVAGQKIAQQACHWVAGATRP